MAGRLGQQSQAWLLARVRMMPNALSGAAPWVRRVFDHGWAPMQALAAQIGGLPPDLWSQLLACAGGHVVIGPGGSRYAPGKVAVRQQYVHNVAFVSVEDLAAENEWPLHVIGHLIDHYLGCAGELDAPWLSDGGGLKPGWREASARLLNLFDLGYAIDNIARGDARDYFAQSLALYCHDRQRLNVADPQVTKWFRSTLWNPAFWKG